MLIYTDHGGSVTLYTLSVEQGSVAPPHSTPLIQPPVAILHLPRVKSSRLLLEAHIRSSPHVVHQIPGRPFEMGQHTRVHMLELSYTRGKQLRLVFHNHFLISLLPLDPGPQTRATFNPVELGWDQWGPEHTRAVSAPDYSHATWYVPLACLYLPHLTPTASI